MLVVCTTHILFTLHVFFKTMRCSLEITTRSGPTVLTLWNHCALCYSRSCTMAHYARCKKNSTIIFLWYIYYFFHCIYLLIFGVRSMFTLSMSLWLSKAISNLSTSFSIWYKLRNTSSICCTRFCAAWFYTTYSSNLRKSTTYLLLNGPQSRTGLKRNKRRMLVRTESVY